MSEIQGHREEILRQLQELESSEVTGSDWMMLDRQICDLIVKGYWERVCAHKTVQVSIGDVLCPSWMDLGKAVNEKMTDPMRHKDEGWNLCLGQVDACARRFDRSGYEGSIEERICIYDEKRGAPKDSFLVSVRIMALSGMDGGRGMPREYFPFPHTPTVMHRRVLKRMKEHPDDRKTEAHLCPFFALVLWYVRHYAKQVSNPSDAVPLIPSTAIESEDDRQKRRASRMLTVIPPEMLGLNRWHNPNEARLGAQFLLLMLGEVRRELWDTEIRVTVDDMPVVELFKKATGIKRFRPERHSKIVLGALDYIRTLPLVEYKNREGRWRGYAPVQIREQPVRRVFEDDILQVSIWFPPTTRGFKMCPKLNAFASSSGDIRWKLVYHLSAAWSEVLDIRGGGKRVFQKMDRDEYPQVTIDDLVRMGYGTEAPSEGTKRQWRYRTRVVLERLRGKGFILFDGPAKMLGLKPFPLPMPGPSWSGWSDNQRSRLIEQYSLPQLPFE
ncbi:MAG: hypothetical protein F4Y00_00835 [Bacteroidetes bacterium SB0662_bin_6]|nr:hypothetical protein [Bacteroidetes bacterium SB0662_bin_6]